MPAYNETPEVVSSALRSIVDQNILRENPKKYEIVFLASAGDRLLEQVLPVVKEFTNKIIVAPRRGKLLARDMGLRASSGEYIVSVDSDSEYPPNWLNMMLEPYSKMRAVGTTGSSGTVYLEPLTNIVQHYGFLANAITARCSTFPRQAYFDAGPFDLSVEKDYSPMKFAKVWEEEEFLFKERLEALGRGPVVFVDAPVEHAYEYGLMPGRGLHSWAEWNWLGL
jgi:glycosyltransferase involved in cell wall biosynthesis